MMICSNINRRRAFTPAALPTKLQPRRTPPSGSPARTRSGTLSFLLAMTQSRRAQWRSFAPRVLQRLRASRSQPLPGTVSLAALRPFAQSRSPGRRGVRRSAGSVGKRELGWFRQVWEVAPLPHAALTPRERTSCCASASNQQNSPALRIEISRSDALARTAGSSRSRLNASLVPLPSTFSSRR